MSNEWNHLGPDQMATNNDPFEGGIVDKELTLGEWFVIANNDDIPSAEGFDTKDEAMQYLQNQVAILRGEQIELPRYTLTQDGSVNLKRLLKDYFAAHGLPDHAEDIQDPRLRDMAVRFHDEFGEACDEFEQSSTLGR